MSQESDSSTTLPSVTGAAATSNYRRLKLHQPTIEQVAACLGRACADAFAESAVDIVDCPDLSKAPFRLAGRGICGGATMVHAGGVPYLMPKPQAEDRRYDLRGLLTAAGCPEGLFIGAGAVSSILYGKNAEFVANLGPLGNQCRVATLANDADYAGGLANCRLERSCLAEIGLLGDGLACRGDVSGQVVRLRATGGWRQFGAGDSTAGIGHFTELLQRALAAEFSDRDLPVGLGGVFCLAGSPARMHVMPDFSQSPLTCVAEVNRWLHFVDMPAPVTCVGALLSHDPRGWGLRLEHFHGWNGDTEACGGHYHNDAQPEAAEYTAYFSVAEAMIRVDPPGGLDSLSDD